MKKCEFLWEKTKKPILCFLGGLMVLLLIISICYFIVHFFYGNSVEARDFVKSTWQDIFWSAMTAIATIAMVIATLGAVHYAKEAYNEAKKSNVESEKSNIESEKSRNYNAFYTMFTQLISIQAELFKEARFNCTKKCFPLSWIKKESVFHNFVCYYENRTKDTDLSIDKIAIIWNDFYKHISRKYDFSKCFKYIYHEIDIILDFETKIKDYDKKDDSLRHYAQLVSGNMNKDELFCYFINLLVVFHENGIGTKEREAHLEFLVKYNFFQDICRVSKRGAHWQMMGRIREILREPGLTKFADMIIINCYR